MFLRLVLWNISVGKRVGAGGLTVLLGGESGVFSVARRKSRAVRYRRDVARPRSGSVRYRGAAVRYHSEAVRYDGGAARPRSNGAPSRYEAGFFQNGDTVAPQSVWAVPQRC